MQNNYFILNYVYCHQSTQRIKIVFIFKEIRKTDCG